ncbi:MAG: cytochrome c3 family protein [Methanocellales archaeon]|nr:cytochrome c3 family protein [Methanocellales archaeon]
MKNMTIPKTIWRLLIIAILIAIVSALGISLLTVSVSADGGMGGPDCVHCHDIKGGDEGHKGHVDVSAMNQTNSIHVNLNSGVSTSLNPDNKRCWACHGNGTQPSGHGHPSNYKSPYICLDCHISGGSQVEKYNAPIVFEHYRNGMDIKAATNASTDVLACISCHQNVNEMVLSNSDPDYGHNITDVDKDGVQGGPNCTYHYGRKRTDLQTGTPPYTNCSYCHQNASTAFPFVNADLKNLENHTPRITNPSCVDSRCHDVGRIHNSTLKMPTTVDYTLCTDCHGGKSRHNDTLDCTKCHGNATNKIHPILYLASDGTFSTSNVSAVNCISCHQEGYMGPQVSDPLHHSEVNTGQRWGDYWTDDLSACTYCHDDTKHDAIALGRPANWKGDNIVGSSVNNSYWCAGCHYQGYQSGAHSYENMVNTFNGSGLNIPPEITNGTYAPNVTGFYEHVCANWSDALCKECHGKFVSGYNVTELMHNVSDGSCGNCHYDFAYMNDARNAPTKYVNSTMFNASVHGPSSGIGCVDCHTTSNHPYPEYYWKWCECCHAVQSNPVDDTDRHNVTSDVRNNMVDGVSVLSIIDCKTCHNATSYENAKTNFGLCRWCHTYPDKTYE